MRKSYSYIFTCNYSPWSKYSGGGQKSTHMLAMELASRGEKVAVLYSKGFLEKVKVPSKLPYDVIWVPFVALYAKMSSPLRFLNPHFFLNKIKQICTSETIVHSQGEEAAFFSELDCYRWVHTNRFPDFPEFLKNFDTQQARPELKLWLRDPKYANVQLCIQGADTLSVTSLHNQQRVHKLFNVHAKVISNGIDPVYFEKSWLATEDCKGIIYYGRMVQDKGVDLLINAFLQLDFQIQEKHPLTLIGQGKQLAQYQALANNHPHIRFEPWAAPKDILEKIIKSRVCVLPSRDESFGNTMLESLATGIPLISTSAGSIPEVVGPHAQLVTSDSIDELREAVQLELNSTPQLNVDAQNFVKNKYSWAATVDQFLEIYQED